MMLAPEIEQFAERAGWTVPGLLCARHALSPEEAALWQISADGPWVKSSWGDYRNAVAALASGFGKLGLPAGGRVGIMAANCKEWDYAQLGIMAAGGVVVGLDLYASDDDNRQIAQCCKLCGLVLGKAEFLGRLGDEVRKNLRFVVCIEASANADVTALASLMGEDAGAEAWNQAQADATATIVFTSGTTGAPKGIAYTHRQVCLAAVAIVSVLSDLREGSRGVCWLPLSNLFQRVINLCAIGLGGQIFYVADPKNIMHFAADIAPHVLIGVPRFYEKLHAGIEQAIARSPLWKRIITRWGLRVGDRHAQTLRAGRTAGLFLTLQRALADRLVLKRMRAILGANLRFMISGSAAMPLRLLEWFHGIGWCVLEAYGLSENIIPVAMNRPGEFRFGSVGLPLRGSDVKLADDGELLVRGPGVFKAYLGADAEARIDSEGFLASGDFAKIDADGFITLVGRKTEIFKTSTGRRVAPAAIENVLRLVRQIEDAAVFGAGRTLPTAVLVTSDAAWQEDPHALCQRLRAEAAALLAALPAHLRPAGAVVTNRAFTVAAGELTTNLKLRRQVIESNYANVLRELEARIDVATGESFEVRSADGRMLLINL